MLEVCVDSVSAAVAACAAGANRIELCSALDVGGVTPCQSLISAVRQSINCELVVLIRPRTGDFLYDDSERKQTRESIYVALGCGADGVVVGGLDSALGLDLPLLTAARQATSGFQLAMHRAFDFVIDPMLAVDQLVAIGFDRLLTSGGSTGNVMNHLAALRELQAHVGERIVVMPGGGVNANNADEVLQATGCRQLHGSFRLLAEPSNPIASDLGTHRAIDSAAIAAVQAILCK